MNIPPVASIPGFRAGERQEGGAKQDRPSREKNAATAKRRTLTESLPSAEYDKTRQEDGSDLGHLTDQTV